MAGGQVGKGANIGAWVMSVLLGVAFLGAGGSKLAGVEMHVQNFARWGYPPWFMTVTGIVEVVAALLMFTPATAGVGAVILVPTMLGAILTHINAAEMQMLGGPVVLLLLSAAVAFLRRDRLVALVEKVRG